MIAGEASETEPLVFVVVVTILGLIIRDKHKYWG